MATLWTGLWYRSKCHRPDVNSPSPLWSYKCWRSENVLEVWIISHARCHLLSINDMSSDDPPLLWPISLSMTGTHASTGAIWFPLRPRITDGIHVCNDRCIYCSQIKKKKGKMCQRCAELQKKHRCCASFYRNGQHIWTPGKAQMCWSGTADLSWSLQSALHCFAIFQHDSLPYVLQRAASLSDLKPIWISCTCPHFTHSSWHFFILSSPNLNPGHFSNMFFRQLNGCFVFEARQHFNMPQALLLNTAW